MSKPALVAILAVFIAWSLLDFVIHGLLLQEIYQSTANLWRPMEQMNMPLMYLVTLAYSACFVFIYNIFVNDKSIIRGIQFGALFGLATGISMGFGSYSYMPIPFSLALGWCAGTLSQSLLAGALVGAIIKPRENRAQ